MAIYRFKDQSTVDAITFVTTEKGSVRGYLHASGTPSPQRLTEITKALREKDLEAVPFMFEGKQTLEVRSFGKEKDLVRILKEAGAVKGDPTIEQEPEDKLSPMDMLRKRSLQASGVTYLVGDYGFFKYNLKEADRLGVAGAICYFLGTVALVGWGRNDQSDLQVHDMAKDLEQFLGREKVHIPEGSAMHAIAHDKKQTTLEKLDEFAHRYPSELFNSVTALAGVFVAASAYKKMRFKPTPGMDAHALRELHQEGFMDFGLGAITAASGTLATLVKEKKPDPDDPPTHGLGKIWEKVQEHPLAISGLGYMIATGCHAGSTYKAWREAKRVGDKMRLASVPGRALFVGMALTSEILLAISSKGHGEGVTSDDSVDKSAYAIAAETIVRQPKEEREWHIQHIAGFLQQPNVMAEAYDVVEKELRKQVELLEKNPWMGNHAVRASQLPAQQPLKATPSTIMQPTSMTAPAAGMQMPQA